MSAREPGEMGHQSSAGQRALTEIFELSLVLPAAIRALRLEPDTALFADELQTRLNNIRAIRADAKIDFAEHMLASTGLASINEVRRHRLGLPPINHAREGAGEGSGA